MGVQGSKDDASVYVNGANRHNDVLTDKESRKYKRYTIHHKRNNNNENDILDISNMIDVSLIENHLNNINNNNNNKNYDNNTTFDTSTTTTTTTTTSNTNTNKTHINNLSISSPNNINYNNINNNNNICKQQPSICINNNSINNNNNNSNLNQSTGGVKSKFLQRKHKAKTISLSNSHINNNSNNISNSNSSSASSLGGLNNNNTNSSNSSIGSSSTGSRSNNTSSNSFGNLSQTPNTTATSHSSLVSTIDNNDSLLSLSSGVGSSFASLDEVESLPQQHQQPIFSRTRSKSLNLHQQRSYLAVGGNHQQQIASSSKSSSNSSPKEDRHSITNNNNTANTNNDNKIQGRKSRSSNALLRTLQRKVKKDKSEEYKEKKEKEKEEKQREKEEKQREKKEKEREKERRERKGEGKRKRIKINFNQTIKFLVPELSDNHQNNKSFENIVSIEENNESFSQLLEEEEEETVVAGNKSKSHSNSRPFYDDLYCDNFKLNNPLSPSFDSIQEVSEEDYYASSQAAGPTSPSSASSQPPPLPRRKPPPLPPKNFRSSNTTPNTSSSNLNQYITTNATTTANNNNSMDTPGLMLSPLSLGQRSPMLSRRQSNLYPPSEPSMPSPCSSQRNSVEIHKLEDIFNYTLLDKIGSGTFSDVHLCRHKETDKQYAIKIIDKSLVQMIASHTDLDISTEVNILSTLSHPHVIKLVEHFESEMNYYIVMEYLSGGELLYQLEETHNNPENKSGVANYTEQSAREIIKQIIHAVAFLHKNNIVHRDLKPENILFNGKSEFATLKIIDFGLASYYKAPLADICGTPDFQAPEMIKRQGYSYPVDIWATGVILYILLCGHPPFQGKNSMAIMSLIMKGEIKFDKPEWENVSDSAKDLISKMLDSDPSKRLTAEQVLQHEWMLIQSRPEDSPRLSGSFHKQLRRYNSQRFFKATGDTLLKSQRFGIYSPELIKRRSIQL
ncbi:putative protein serine/threonine kinase [Heterostelium album PN500]|uniref:non-specific serine/threonine protein kinase n=1 Tax=Heterostelium pallidum (strain ATCC 26659 / Pp 5 / PN500) TaxID=670386 RepID=D3BJM0_HETP5|nr:putative protein serine/threonine kinase [Heterostelium album PN500]EFA78100.1 putative protein serine/threonine kinase [Heterostelium album PN500]|eukprot:XP_020430227.1 putative protein serine/threonine kinase [Heterostelium album PN500]